MAIGLYIATASICVVLAAVVLDIMGVFGSKNQFQVDGKVWQLQIVKSTVLLTWSSQTVVLTGGSQGMGRGLGKLLAQKGANVVIVARNKEKLAKAIEYISVCRSQSTRSDSCSDCPCSLLR